MTAAPAATTDAQLGALPEWDLTHLYLSIEDPAINADMRLGLEMAEAFQAKAKGTLEGLVARRDGDAIAGLLSEYELIQDRLGKLVSFAGLVYAGDTTDPKRAKFYADLQDQITRASTVLIFFELELNRLDPNALEALYATSPALAHYRPWITDVAKERPHQLADEIETLFTEKSVSGAAAWNRLYDETIASLRFSVEGEELTIEQALNLLQDPSEARRKAGAEALAETFKANLRIFSLVTNVLAKDKEISDRWHKFEDVADARHLSNRVERAVVDALVASVRENFPRLSHRYYALKAKWLGMDALNHWDRNAPLPRSETRAIPWHEARDTVLEAYGKFAPEMEAIARRFFDEQWIDAPVRPGKAPGAFAHPTVPSAHPYVLVNYLGKTRDVMTLAHELGHGVHQVLAGPNGALMAPTPLTLAETASVFGEMLTFKTLLARATTPAEKKAMLASKVEDMINTVVRQIAFYTFERKVHTARKEGELTAEQLGEIWLDVQAESLGPAVKLGPGYDTFWTYIPHFIHSPFYVYAYAFGDCLVNSLYATFEKSESGFQEKYFNLLKAGGTKHHSELLKPFGLDATDPNFWSLGLGVISGMIDELEAMEG